MARIEFSCCEQKMEDLRGYCKTYLDPAKNPYTTDQLSDDDFNFISGINYALSFLTDLFLNNVEYYIDDDTETLKAIKLDVAKKSIESFAQFSYGELSMYITSAIEEDYSKNMEDEN